MEEHEQLMQVVKQLAEQVVLIARSVEKLQHRMKALEFENIETVPKYSVPDLNQKYDG